MYQFTTPTLKLNISGIDFNDVKEFRVSFQKGMKKLTKIIEISDPKIDKENNLLYVDLTQRETASLPNGTAIVQARVVMSNGRVLATDAVEINVRPVIDEVYINE